MQIAKEPLLYHLCVVAGERQRRSKPVGEGVKGVKDTRVLLISSGLGPQWLEAGFQLPSQRLKLGRSNESAKS